MTRELAGLALLVVLIGLIAALTRYARGRSRDRQQQAIRTTGPSPRIPRCITNRSLFNLDPFTVSPNTVVPASHTPVISQGVGSHVVSTRSKRRHQERRRGTIYPIPMSVWRSRFGLSGLDESMKSLSA